uniref:Uncharacterized protein n=1 Tax=Sphaerodactylus townsendi TaxID=933632 RepID=A0ACB8EYF0_9SAUR
MLDPSEDRFQVNTGLLWTSESAHWESHPVAICKLCSFEKEELGGDAVACGHFSREGVHMRQLLPPGAPWLMPTDHDRLKHFSLTDEGSANGSAGIAKGCHRSFCSDGGLEEPWSGLWDPEPPGHEELRFHSAGEGQAS